MGWAARTITSRLAWLVALLLVGLGVTWWQVTEKAVDAVEVRTVQAPRCTGTTIERRSPRTGAGPRSTILLSPRMACHLELDVVNTGRLPVHLDDLVLPLMGPDGGAAVRVKAVRVGERLPLQGGIAAVAALDRWLAAEEALRVEVDYVFRPRGCTEAGGILWVPTAQLEPSLLLRSTVVQGESIHFEGTSSSSC